MINNQNGKQTAFLMRERPMIDIWFDSNLISTISGGVANFQVGDKNLCVDQRRFGWHATIPYDLNFTQIYVT